MKHVLFICTGNVCRSPMAEGLSRLAWGQSPEVTFSSAGIGAVLGQAPSPYAVEVMRDLGCDISRQRSQPTTAELVRKADYIFVMTYGHLDSLLLLYPAAADKTFLLREFQPGLSPDEREVDDPIGQAVGVYRACRDQIQQSIPFLMEMVQSGVVATSTSGAAGQICIGLAGDSAGRVL